VIQHPKEKQSKKWVESMIIEAKLKLEIRLKSMRPSAENTKVEKKMIKGH
jgi:hypothetical protein